MGYELEMKTELRFEAQVEMCRTRQLDGFKLHSRKEMERNLKHTVRILVDWLLSMAP
jgi:hypothetical protein